MKIINLVIAGLLFIFVGIFFYPILLMILSFTIGGVFTDKLNQIAMDTILMSQVIATIVFFIPGIWFLKKARVTYHK